MTLLVKNLGALSHGGLPNIVRVMSRSQIRFPQHTGEKNTLVLLVMGGGRESFWNIAEHSGFLNKACPQGKLVNQSLINWGITKASILSFAKAFDCVDHNKLWKILKEMGIPDHLTCLLRNLYSGQEATVRTGHGTRDWFQIGKGVCQGCILSRCLFNLHAEYTSWETLDWKNTSWNQDCREKYQ